MLQRVEKKKTWANRLLLFLDWTGLHTLKLTLGNIQILKVCYILLSDKAKSQRQNDKLLPLSSIADGIALTIKVRRHPSKYVF